MKFLFAEDEVELSRAVCAVLRHQGDEADPAYDGEEALRKARAGSYDCMVFDVMMPRMDGISVVRALRADGDRTPMIILTAKTQIEDKITGLDAGADDYITKPFAMRELLARIRSVARRSGYQAEKLELGNVTLDTGEQELIAKNCMRLGSKEARLMELFMRNPGKVLGGSDLFRKVWGESEEKGDDTLFLYISYLRQKLNAIQADLLIEGELGGSYVLRQRDA
jgi:hypothetical protein